MQKGNIMITRKSNFEMALAQNQVTVKLGSKFYGYAKSESQVAWNEWQKSDKVKNLKRALF